MSSRDVDLASVVELRLAREEAVHAASQGRIAEVLDLDPNDARTATYVVKLLDVAPGLGKVSGRRLLADLGLGQFTRVRDLGVDQRGAILRACGAQS